MLNTIRAYVLIKKPITDNMFKCPVIYVSAQRIDDISKCKNKRESRKNAITKVELLFSAN